jgi:16S rRNA processing protein RimM
LRVSEAGWVPVGRLKRTRGNRGEIIGEIYSQQPGRAARLTKVMLESEGRTRVAEVEHYWNHDGRPVFKFAGIDSISEAEQWQGADILAPEAERVVPEDGEYTYADLIGCRVVDSGMTPIGVVSGVEDYGGPPLLRMEAEDGREILVPFARSICKEINVAEKIIRVELPAGLLELP